MKKVSKILTATISCLMATTLVLPVSAEGEVEKKESVYTVLNSDGSVSSITVSDTLHSDSGFSNYQDKSDLQNVENLKSSDPVSSSNGNLIWNTDATDIYYQGTSNKELPLTVKITYTLDGNAVSADDLAGKSGHLKINIKLSNSSKQSYVVNGKTYNLVTPFVTGIGGMFDDDVFSNVTVDNGKVTSDSSHSIVVGVIVPGLKSGLSQVLDSDLMHRLDGYLADEVNIEADVTDFESPTLMMAAATSTDAIKDEFDDIDEFSSIFDKLDDLKEATNQLIDGTNSLYDGAVKLNDGVATLQDGTKQLVSGSQQVADGAKSAATGGAKLETGLATLVGNSESLVEGVNSATEAILKVANETLDSNESIKNDKKYATLTWSNFSDQLDTYMGVTETMRNTAFNQIKDQLKAKGVTIDDDTLRMIIYMAAKDGSTDFEKYITEKQSDLSTAVNVQQAQSDAAKISSGDFSKVDRALTLATYEGAIGTVKSVVYNNTVVKDDEGNVTTEGTVLTTRQAEEVLKTASNSGITDVSSATKDQITTVVTSVLNSVNADAPSLGPDSDDLKSIISGLRATQTDGGVYKQLSDTLKSQSDQLNDSTIALLLTEGCEQHADKTSITEMMVAAQTDAQVATTIATNKATSKTDEGKQIINSYLSTLVKASQKDEFTELSALKTNLTGLATLRTGIKDYTDGVSEAYAGSKELSSGLSSLSSGTNDLNAGIQKVNSGASDLKDGSQQLADGAKTLKEGMQKYNDEAISKLTNNSRISSIEQASDLLEAISKDENNYNNFSGISDGTDGSIKFVFKINGVKKAKSDDTSSETTTKVSFWQRILNLFKF